MDLLFLNWNLYVVVMPEFIYKILERQGFKHRHFNPYYQLEGK